MSILVTGSMAIDRIMVFPDRFKNHILPDKLHILSVSFHVPTLQQFFGGCAGNIAYGLKLLEADPLILATVGNDFGDYAAWLDECGIRRDGLRVLADAHTSQCFITTDLDDNQIVAFHPGAMDRAVEARVEDLTETIDVGIVGPNDRDAMQAYARALKARGVATVIDPGQQTPNFEGPELVELLDGADVYVVNDYEWALTLERTGLEEDALAERVGAILVTKGAEGSTLREGDRRVDIPVVKPDQVIDPTGCGDAYRSGLLYGRARGLSVEASARIGSVMGSFNVERHGTQSVETTAAAIRERHAGTFGEPF